MLKIVRYVAGAMLILVFPALAYATFYLMSIGCQQEWWWHPTVSMVIVPMCVCPAIGMVLILKDALNKMA